MEMLMKIRHVVSKWTESCKVKICVVEDSDSIRIGNLYVRFMRLLLEIILRDELHRKGKTWQKDRILSAYFSIRLSISFH